MRAICPPKVTPPSPVLVWIARSPSALKDEPTNPVAVQWLSFSSSTITVGAGAGGGGAAAIGGGATRSGTRARGGAGAGAGRGAAIATGLAVLLSNAKLPHTFGTMNV